MQDFKYFKKIISKNILFMMILVLLLVGVSERIVNLMVANDSYVLDRNKSIFRILREPENSVDIIVLGDSLGMTSISPMAWWRLCSGQRRRNIGKKTSSEVVGLENLTTSELYYFRKLAA